MRIYGSEIFHFRRMHESIEFQALVPLRKRGVRRVEIANTVYTHGVDKQIRHALNIQIIEL